MEDSTKLLALLYTSYRWKYLYKVGKKTQTLVIWIKVHRQNAKVGLLNRLL